MYIYPAVGTVTVEMSETT